MAETSGKSNIIRVPKTPKSSYNPNRPIKGNTLLEHQLKNLRALELRLQRSTPRVRRASTFGG